MADFRKEFYKKYNSTFKNHLSSYDQSVIQAEWNWYKYKYLPLLRHFNKNSSILELGCGRGIMLEYLREIGFSNVKGIDVSEEQIQNATAKKLDATVSDVFEFLENSLIKYDIVIALDFVEHFKKIELVRLFQLIFDILKPDGAMIIHTPNGQAFVSHRMIYGDLTHLTIFSPYSMQQILKLVGFNKISFYEKDPSPKNVKGVLRFVLWKILKTLYNILLLIETGRTEKILTQSFICLARKT